MVSPEELTLLKPAQPWTTASQMHKSLDSDQTIDSNLLRQLSEAGLSIGQQIFDLNGHPTSLAVQKFAETLNCDSPKQTALLETLFEQIKTMIHFVHEKSDPDILSTLGQSSDNTTILPNKSNDSQINHSTDNIQSHIIDIMSSTVIDCVVLWAKHLSDTELVKNVINKTEIVNGFGDKQPEIDNDTTLYNIISRVLVKKLNQFDERKSNDGNNEILNAIEMMITSPITLQQFENTVNSLAEQIIQGGKEYLIEALINNRIETNADILHSLCTILQPIHEENELIMAIQELYESEPKLMQTIITELQNNFSNGLDKSTTETSTAATVIETLKKAIVLAVQQTANDDINQILAKFDENTQENHLQNDSSSEKLNIYLMDTISLAKALGLTNCAQHLMNSMNSHNDVGERLKQDENVIELLQRVIVMHKLAQNDNDRQQSLQLLRTDPYTARNDKILRNLWRSSGLCTIRSDQKSKLTDSRDVPLTLIYSGNQLAIEDFLMRRETKSRGAFLICKDGFQAVVPRESSHDVLIGKCAYTMLDENGIRHFEPLHVFSALKLKNIQMFAHRFQAYSCDDDVDKLNANKKLNSDIDVDSILTMSSTPQTTSSNSINNDYYSDMAAYRTKYLPKRDYYDSYAKRKNIFRPNVYIAGNQVNYRRSFYL